MQNKGKTGLELQKGYQWVNPMNGMDSGSTPSSWIDPSVFEMVSGLTPLSWVDPRLMFIQRVA